MVYKHLISFCIFLFAITVASGQQNINFTSLTTRDGLSSNSINAILKDRYGLMWFATEDGLNRFDGIHITVYRHKPGDSTSLPTNEILSLHEDKAGSLWVGTGGGALSLYNRQKDAFITLPTGNTADKLRNDVIRYICSDYLGNVWVAHYSGINIIEPNTHKISVFNTGIPPDKLCSYLFEDSHHNMWIGTQEGVFCYDPVTRLSKQFIHKANDSSSLASNAINAITEDVYGHIWIGTGDGLSMLLPDGKTFLNYKQGTANNSRSLSNNYVSTLAVGNDRKLWIGTSNGLDILNIRSGEITHLYANTRDVQSLSYNGITTIFIDKTGIYWIGTYQGGVNKYDTNLNLFNLVQGNPLDVAGLHAKIVNAFAENGNNRVFIGTEGGGMSLFDPETKALQHFNLHSRRPNSNNYLSVLSLKVTSNKQLLIGTYGEGLFIMNPPSEKYEQLLKGDKPEDLNSNDVYCIMEDHLGQRWLGTNGKGINILSTDNKVIFRLTPAPVATNDIRLPTNGYIRDICEDKKGNIWIGSHGDGLAVYEPNTRRFKVYNTNNSNLPNNKIQTILQDSYGNIWVGTLGGGLCMLQRETGQFTIYSEKDGIPNTNIKKLVEDKNRTLWFSSNNGLSSLHIATKTINNYNYHNGVQNNNFVHGSGIYTSNGNLYFGGLEGFNYFNPEYLHKNKNIPTVLFTDLKVVNQSVVPSEKGPIKENIILAKEIHLNYEQNFAISYVGLNYTAPEQNEYAYRLEGFDKDWNYVGSSTTASYTNLDPGTYTLRVIASNNDGVWNKEGASIKIYVHPPFWRTTYAYILYVMFMGALLLYIRHLGIQRLKRQFVTEQQKAQAERIHELDQLKIKFLTNLSHEFRTPISLILGPAENLLLQGTNAQQNSQLQLIKRNGKRLLNLVNQLLDFRKMEEQELKLQETEGELVAFIKETTDSFKDLAENKKIKFEFLSSIAQLYTRFDHDKLERIIFNLLSNAFKFTLKGGSISLQLEKDESRSNQQQIWTCFKIKDSGVGIPNDQIDKIFERFFQHTTAGAVLNQGTGIGLSITKEFVEMQGGTISVTSEPGKGTLFTVHLPFTLLMPPATTVANVELPAEEPTSDLVEMAVEGKASEVVERQNDVSVLLVEDDEDFRFYLKENLAKQYKVHEAADGKEGWQKALFLHPNLIISDISMPYMNGIELCKKIKSDKRTNHTPVILLTALASEKDQLEGLETGANDYITKPFNFELLNAKIKNLLNLNSTLKTTYTKQIRVVTPEAKVESEDERLMISIMKYLEENLDNPQLSVEDMSKQLGMSRSSLYNKLLELTGQTPVEFIRSTKLEKAAILLEKSDMTIAEIAYTVGFSTPNYFAKSFKAKYNMSPSEYIQKKNSNKNTGNEQVDSSD